MKKLCLMFVGAIFAFQTIAVAQTTPTKKKKKTTKTAPATASTKTPGQEYSTSDRSGVNSYNAATDSVALGTATDTLVPVKKKAVKKTTKKTTTQVKSN